MTSRLRWVEFALNGVKYALTAHYYRIALDWMVPKAWTSRAPQCDTFFEGPFDFGSGGCTNSKSSSVSNV